MACIEYRLEYPLTGVAQRSLITRMSRCAVFLVSHASPTILYMLEKLARKRGARYVVIYAVLTDTLEFRPSHGLYINASHHEKYYLVDGVVLAEGTANLTDSEIDDRTLNTLKVYVCSTLEELEVLDEYKSMARMLRIALRGTGLDPSIVEEFLRDTPCSRLAGLSSRLERARV